MTNTNEKYITIGGAIYFFSNADFNVEYIRGIFMDAVSENVLKHIEFKLSQCIEQSNGNKTEGLLQFVGQLNEEAKKILYDYILSNDENKESIIRDKVLNINL